MPHSKSRSSAAAGLIALSKVINRNVLRPKGQKRIGKKKKAKVGRSYMTTKAVTKRRQDKINNDSDHYQMTYFHKRFKPDKRVRLNPMPVLKFHERDGYLAGGSPGLQTVSELSWLPNTDLNTYINPQLYGLLPSGTLPAGSTTTGNSLIPYCLYTKIQVDFNNSSNVTAYYKVYEVTPRHDTNTGPTSAWIQGLYLEQAAGVGGTTSLIPGGVSALQTAIDAVPSESLRFKAMWRIETTKSAIVPPGHTLRHTALMTNCAFRGGYDALNTATYIANKSRVLMFVQYGEPCVGTSVNRDVTTAATETLMITKRTSAFTYLRIPSTVVSTQNNLSRVVQTYATVLPESDALANVTQA